MNDAAWHCEVAVVGGGIVGSALACALDQAGFDVQLIERGSAPPAFDPAQVDPRVYAISAGSADFVHALGLWRAVRDARAEPIQRMQVWDRDAAYPLRFDAADAGVPSLGWIVEHRLLARTLWSALPAARVHTGLDVRHVRFDPEAGAELALSDGRTLHARLAIGAEGAESALREAAGIDVAGWSYASTAVVCHIRAEHPHRGAALQRFLPSGPVALLPMADGRRSLVWSTTDADARELLALPDAAFAAHLQAAVQDAAGALSAPTRRLSFPLRLLHARQYVAPCCALVGDSAHVIHPLAGQGLNLGLADAHCLVSELAGARRARRDWSALRTLQRFERARQAESLEMLALTDALGRAFALDLPGWRALLSLGLRAVDRLDIVKSGLASRASRSA
ncbi:MAG: UbiH/UbiF family hydroxylase [Panacagrimonas sp.]|nr:FAD-dependent monooxygenase [Panacagrimonas sp.]MCC2655764.1 UbiH/UbiF family hydroxylase [Panacagrimonas sp.]